MKKNLNRLRHAIRQITSPYVDISYSIAEDVIDNYHALQESFILYRFISRETINMPEQARQFRRVISDFFVVLSTPLVCVLSYFIVTIALPFTFIEEVIGRH